MCTLVDLYLACMCVHVRSSDASMPQSCACTTDSAPAPNAGSAPRILLLLRLLSFSAATARRSS